MSCKDLKILRVASLASRAVRPDRTRSTQGRKADRRLAYLGFGGNTVSRVNTVNRV